LIWLICSGLPDAFEGREAPEGLEALSEIVGVDGRTRARETWRATLDLTCRALALNMEPQDGSLWIYGASRPIAFMDRRFAGVVLRV
jgi:hypothetical protein